MQKVTGIGGVFFKVKNPEAMADWYNRHLGIETDGGFKTFEWKDPQGREGQTVFSMFAQDSDYFGRAESQFMINFRVADLEALLAELRNAGIEILKAESHEYGRFAWINDPEGNRIELWEPAS